MDSPAHTPAHAPAHIPAHGPDAVRVSLAPSPGYCLKSTALSAAVVARPPPARALAIPAGTKVFVNVAWDPSVPPPPPPAAADASLARAVPVVVSEPRPVSDKAGQPSVVFDCVYHTTLKARVLTDVSFRDFVNELSLQRIELQTSAAAPSSAPFVLSRDLKTPNIPSKGKLLNRSVLVPRALYPAARELPPQPATALIQHLDIPTPGTEPSAPTTPTHRWHLASGKRSLLIDVPALTRDLHATTTLDVEPHRILFSAPPLYALDVAFPPGPSPVANAAPDPTQHAFDVDSAVAEWRVADGVLVVSV